MKKNKFIGGLLVSLICCVILPNNLLWAADDIPVIGTEALKHELDHGEPMVLVNALSPIEFKNLTIKGSINIPASKVSADHPLMPKDKKQLLVFFCKGPDCTKSIKAARKALDLGYTNVKVYEAGLPDWIRKRFPVASTEKYRQVDIPKMYPQEVYEELDSFVILDIRGAEAKQIGEIKHGLVINIPLADLEDKYKALAKGKTIVIVDLVGRQVDICGRFLVHKGYSNLVTLRGGARAWLKMIRRIEKKKGDNGSKH